MNGDGRMDFNEFSIACKLINLKLKGMELPKSLPPQVSPLFLHAEGDGIILFFSSSGQLSFVTC
jgi:hypothetical protein